MLIQEGEGLHFAVGVHSLPEVFCFGRRIESKVTGNTDSSRDEPGAVREKPGTVRLFKAENGFDIDRGEHDSQTPHNFEQVFY
jgi:hypothetical protein